MLRDPYDRTICLMLNSFYKIEVILDQLLITFCEFISDPKNTTINSFKSLSSKSSIRP